MPRNTTSHTSRHLWITGCIALVVFLGAWYIFSQSSSDTRTPLDNKIQPKPTHTSTGISSGVSDSRDTNPLTSPVTATSATTQACTREYDPVCGIDGKTYPNACVAGSVKIAHEGLCVGDDGHGEDDPVVATGTSMTRDTEEYYNGGYLVYTNTGAGYSFAMPKNSMYMGGGVRDGASHTMGVAVYQSGAEMTFDTAPVQVYFYKKTPANPPVGAKSVSTADGVVYVVTPDTTTDARVTKIVDTILASAK